MVDLMLLVLLLHSKVTQTYGQSVKANLVGIRHLIFKKEHCLETLVLILRIASLSGFL